MRMVCVAVLVISALGSIVANPVLGATPPQIDVSIDTSNQTGTNGYQTGFQLDQDWSYFRDSLACRSLTSAANFKLVRVITFKDTSPQPCTYWYESTRTGKWDWTTTDKLIQQVFASGAQPLVTLKSFPAIYGSPPGVPPGMKINPATNLPDSESFAAYCAAWVKHFKSIGKPIKYWEVFNEAWYYFFKSWGVADSTRLANFVKLLDTCVKRMREADPAILVGNDAGTYKCFLDYYVTHGAGLQFLSFHKYDTGSITSSESSLLNAAETHCFQTSSTMYSPNDARNKYYSAKGVKPAVLLTETNLNYIYEDGADPRIQKVVGAVWTALMLRSCILGGVRFSVYYCWSSSKSSQSGTSTHGYGFGMINRDDSKPWYPYYVQKMFALNLATGDKIVRTTSTSSEVRPLAWIHAGKLNLMIICKANSARNLRLRGISGSMNYNKIDSAISYTSPRVQTGSINSANLVSLRGYTVMLLQKV